jgi:hypothetical protein
MRVFVMVTGSSKWQISWTAVMVALILVAGCAPKKPVYVPSEWQPPPAQQSLTPPPVSPTQTAKQTAIIKPPPEIKESDIALPSEAPAKPSEKKPPQPPPQHLASMHLVDKAKALLAQGKADPAIPLLEQAIQVDVHNGEAFFNLAKAWRMKGSRQKALQFAQKAEILFQDDPAKQKQLFAFEADLYKEMGDVGKMNSYRQKASKLK